MRTRIAVLSVLVGVVAMVVGVAAAIAGKRSGASVSATDASITVLSSATDYSCGVATSTASWRQATELSGLAAGRKNPRVLWTHNDSGDSERVFAMNEHAQLLGTYWISGHAQRDWEDISVGPGPASGTSYVYVGAIGANTPRNDVYVYRFPEPSVSLSQPASTSVGLSRVAKLRMVYPNREQNNAESLAIDPRTGDLYIVTKHSSGLEKIYVYPHSAQNPAIVYTLRLVKQIQFPSQATAADFAPDGREFQVKGYTWGRIFQIPRGVTVREALSTKAAAVPYSSGEAVTYKLDNSGYFEISEGTSKPLMFFKRE